MLNAFDLNLKWLPYTVVKEVNEKVEMLVRQDVASIFVYQRIVLNLAAGELNPRRLLMIQFFRTRWRSIWWKKNFRDVLERVPESGIVTLAENLVYGASGDLPETNQRDKSHQRICPTFAHLRLQAGERVMVEKEILWHLIPRLSYIWFLTRTDVVNGYSVR